MTDPAPQAGRPPASGESREARPALAGASGWALGWWWPAANYFRHSDVLVQLLPILEGISVDLDVQLRSSVAVARSRKRLAGNPTTLSSWSSVKTVRPSTHARTAGSTATHRRWYSWKASRRVYMVLNIIAAGHGQTIAGQPNIRLQNAQNLAFAVRMCTRAGHLRRSRNESRKTVGTGAYYHRRVSPPLPSHVAGRSGSDCNRDGLPALGAGTIRAGCLR